MATSTDQNEIIVVTTGMVMTWGLALAGLSLPSPTAASIVTTATIGIDAITQRPPEPFEWASYEWEEMEKELTSFHSDVKELVGKVDEYWKGPGADAFCAYLTDDFLPGVKTLADAAGTAKTITASVAESFQSNLLQYFDITSTTMALMVAAKALLLIPKAGVALYEIAATAIAVASLLIMGYQLLQAFEAVMDDVKQSETLQAAISDLYNSFTSTSGGIEDGLKKDYKSSKSKVESPTEWSKE